MQINPGIFKAYDIRGVYNEDFNDQTAYDLGLAYSYFRKKETGKKENLKIAVGCDMRVSSPALKKKLTQGLLDGGVHVVDIGLTSTPTFYFAVAHFDYDGGILVSASHNPKEYNGFKLVRNKALPIGKNNGIMDLKELVLSGELSTTGSKGTLSQQEGILTEQIKHDLRFADPNKIKDFKIVIDTANSMGAMYFDALFNGMPNCQIIKMNWQLDGTFPAHEADPFKLENTEELRKRVLAEKADLGIATDGDGDRIFFIDNQGELVEPGITRAILCKIFLKEKPGSKIAYDIRPGKITEDIILENGGTPIVTPVGHSLIKDITIKEGAYFAGESSGHFFLNMGEDGCYEVPVIVTLKILQELSESVITFSEYIRPYQRYYHSGEINNRVADVKAKIEEIKEKYQDGKQNDLDGITVEYEDYWFNVRGSNTEPLIRLNLEARTRETMEEKREEVLKIIIS